MNKKIYFAPMEGITDSIYRNTYEKTFGGIDKYFTPFLSPNDTKKFTTREWREIAPEINDVKKTVPQLLTNKSEHFLWACNEIAPLGYKEINFNLGCPSGTVVAKKKGSGMLYYPEELDRLLYEIFAGLPSELSLSIKTRIGKASPDEFYDILEIYNKYPISELTIHPRIQSDFYREPVRPEYFDFAYKNTSIPLVYNGEIKTPEDFEACLCKYPDINAIMIGRGLISNPSFWESTSPKMLRSFHDELLQQYTDTFSGDKPVLYRMKELWAQWAPNFPASDKALKKIRKANKIVEYKAAVNELI